MDEALRLARQILYDSPYQNIGITISTSELQDQRYQWFLNFNLSLATILDEINRANVIEWCLP